MRDIYKAITDLFVEQLKRGTVPWQKPWQGAQNIVSQKQYRGINALLLGSSDFGSPNWLTFKQARDLGGSINKGAKSTPVIYYKLLKKTDDAGNPVMRPNGREAVIPMVRWSNAFNLEQTSGIEPPAQTPTKHDSAPLDRAEEVKQGADFCGLHHTGFAALYSPKDDVIRVPSPQSFKSPEDYYHTLFHEMTHATGHGTRLDREGITSPVQFGSERYAKEELIAELGASFISNEAGILDAVRFDNSAAYLNSWVRNLENDPRMIVSAASQAQRGADFVLGIRQEQAVDAPQLSPEGMPVNWARERGIDTRIPGFALRDQDGDGASNLQEWKQSTNPRSRESRPLSQGTFL